MVGLVVIPVLCCQGMIMLIPWGNLLWTSEEWQGHTQDKVSSQPIRATADSAFSKISPAHVESRK